MNLKKVKKQRDKDLESVSKNVAKIIKHNKLFEPSEISKHTLRATYYLLEEQKYHEANTAGGEYTLSPFHTTFISTFKTESKEILNEIVKSICYVSLDKKAGYREWLKQEQNKVVKAKNGKRLQIYKNGTIAALITLPLIRSILPPVLKSWVPNGLAVKHQKGSSSSTSAAIRAGARNIIMKHGLAIAMLSGDIKKSKKDDGIENKKKDGHKVKSWMKKLKGQVKESVKDSKTLAIKSSESMALESLVEIEELEISDKNTAINEESEELAEEENKDEKTVKKKKGKFKFPKIHWKKFKKSK